MKVKKFKKPIDKNKEQENVQELLFKKMPIGCILWDEKFRAKLWNPAAEKIFGYSAKEALGKHPYDIIVPKSAQKQVTTIWRRLLRGDTSANLINENNTKKGNKIICSWTNTPIKKEKNNVIGVLSMVKNISEEQKNKNALIESERRLAEVIDFLPDATFVLNKEGKVIAWNRAVEKMTKTKAKKVLGKGDYTHAMPFYGRRRPVLADLILQPELLQKIIQNKKYPFIKKEKDTLVTEILLKNVGGKDIFVWAKAAPLYNAAGKVSGVVESVRDITDKKKLEKELHERANRLEELTAKDEAILWSLGESLRVFDITGKILKVNRAFEKLTGWTMEEVLGKKVEEILPQEDERGKKISLGARNVFKVLSGKVGQIEISGFYIRKDKTKFPMSGVITPVYLKNEIIGAIEVFRDITKEKELDKAKSEFVSLASHQLRTPLSIIKWTLNSLDKQDEFFQKNQEKIKDVYESNEHLIALVNNLLNITRIESGKIIVNKKKVGLLNLVKEACKNCQKQAQNRKQKLKFIFEGKIDHVFVDPILFSEAFCNVLGNAFNYGLDKSTVTVKVKRINGDYLISVHNFGPVIGEQEKKKIFTKFYRGPASPARNFSGSGLGLFFTKATVEANGGKIWFESIKNKGTTFYFTVPIK